MRNNKTRSLLRPLRRQSIICASKSPKGGPIAPLIQALITNTSGNKISRIYHSIEGTGRVTRELFPQGNGMDNPEVCKQSFPGLSTHQIQFDEGREISQSIKFIIKPFPRIFEQRGRLPSRRDSGIISRRHSICVRGASLSPRFN